MLRLGIRPCEVEEPAEQVMETGYWDDGVGPCRFAMPEDDQQWEPSEDWCKTCLDRRDIVNKSRKLRKHFGGLASAMMTAHRATS